MNPLLFIALLSVAGCATAASSIDDSYWAEHESLRGFAGTDACLGCRLEHEVDLSDGRIVLDESPSECSAWVIQHLPEHRHHWTPMGCWGNNDTIRCFRNSWLLLSPSADDWLAYLQSLPRARRSEVVTSAAANRDSAAQLRQECESWVEQRKAGGLP